MNKTCKLLQHVFAVNFVKFLADFTLMFSFLKNQCSHRPDFCRYPGSLFQVVIVASFGIVFSLIFCHLILRVYLYVSQSPQRSQAEKERDQLYPHDPDETATSDKTYILTPGIDIGNYEVVGVGPLCIWDTAGQIEFHVTHSMFLGSENAMAVIAYDLRGGYKEIDVSLLIIRPV